MIFNFFKSKQQQLFDAIEAKNLSKVKRLISDPKVDINAKNKDGYKPLHRAVIQNDLEMIRLLIENGADVNSKEDKYGATPLIVAAQLDHPEIAKLLIENGADINVKDYKGWTTLHKSTRRGSLEISKLLIEKKIMSILQIIKEGHPSIWLLLRDVSRLSER